MVWGLLAEEVQVAEAKINALKLFLIGCQREGESWHPNRCQSVTFDVLRQSN
jgi:hypothetical protein